MASKIEQAIDALEDYVNNCKYMIASTTKISVNKDEIDELIRELRLKLPEEIENYRKIISNRDAIINNAQNKANAMLKEATDQTMQLINEHEIMTQAYAKANEVVSNATQKAQEILDDATLQANSLKADAMKYTDDLLASVESIITTTVDLSVNNYNELISNLNSCNSVVKGNRAELNPIDEELGNIETDEDTFEDS